jgi:hypothetical protein
LRLRVESFEGGPRFEAGLVAELLPLLLDDGLVLRDGFEEKEALVARAVTEHY